MPESFGLTTNTIETEVGIPGVITPIDHDSPITLVREQIQSGWGVSSTVVNSLFTIGLVGMVGFGFGRASIALGLVGALLGLFLAFFLGFVELWVMLVVIFAIVFLFVTVWQKRAAEE